MKGVVTVKGSYIMVDIVRYVLHKLSIIIWYISSLVQGCILVKKLCFFLRRTKAKAMESICQKARGEVMMELYR